jgi:hypothetical protein
MLTRSLIDQLGTSKVSSGICEGILAANASVICQHQTNSVHTLSSYCTVLYLLQLKMTLLGTAYAVNIPLLLDVSL